ncbi:MAG: hypothetical protein H6825_13450 [Planctomycetes bacterium]|nr:hypothetical protein [Planctomycetota bacterium]
MRPTLLASLLVALLTACGGQKSFDDAAADLQKSYDAGDDAAVLAEAPKLLERAKAESASEAQSWKVQALELKANARAGHGDEVVAELKSLSASYGKKIDAQLYSQLLSCAKDAGELGAAIEIGGAALKAFPEQKKFFDPMLKDLAARAKAGGDQAQQDALSQLGYLGGGGDEEEEQGTDSP